MMEMMISWNPWTLVGFLNNANIEVRFFEWTARFLASRWLSKSDIVNRRYYFNDVNFLLISLNLLSRTTAHIWNAVK